jgi:hypothetical protein
MIRGAIRTSCGHTHTMVEPPLTVMPKLRPGPVPAASRGCARVSGMVRYEAVSSTETRSHRPIRPSTPPTANAARNPSWRTPRCRRTAHTPRSRISVSAGGGRANLGLRRRAGSDPALRASGRRRAQALSTGRGRGTGARRPACCPNSESRAVCRRRGS